MMIELVYQVGIITSKNKIRFTILKRRGIKKQIELVV